MSTETVACVKLHLAGAFLLTVNNEPVHKFHSNKTQALLAYLVLEASEPVSRDHIASVLWAGYTRKSGRASLRMTLSNLRRTLEPYSDLIVASRNTIQFRRDHPQFWCDALHIQQFTTQPLSTQFETTLTKYDCLLLVGFDDIDSEQFSAWLMHKRSEYATLITTLHAKASQIVETQHNLPRLLTPMFGRSAEIHELKTHLTHPDIPLITLLGPGGIGKTALALVTAHQLTHAFTDGIWFVPLDKLITSASNDPAQQIAYAIAHTLNFIPDSSKRPLTTQLASYLAQQQMLIVLDNFEHVIGAASYILDLLATSTQLTILVTSRQRLNVMPEKIMRLFGLPVPTAQERDVPSVELFSDRLERLARTITLDEKNWRAVGTICRTLNGLPLGIELAAIACEQTSPVQLQQHLESDFNMLHTEMASFPERQRNLWAIVEYSWQMLPLEAQRVLLQCALVRGTFSAEAIACVTQASTAIIEQLVHYVLLIAVGDDQYQMHAQLQAFCEQKATATPTLRGWVRQGQQRHATYYLTSVSHQLPLILSQPKTTINLIRQQLDNLEQSWRWAIDHHADDLITASAPTLMVFFRATGLVELGVEWLQAAISVQQPSAMQAFLLIELAALHCENEDYETTLLCLQKARSLSLMSPSVTAHADLIEGIVYGSQNDHANSIAALQLAFSYYEDALSAESIFFPIDPHTTTFLRHRATQTAHVLGKSCIANQQPEIAEKMLSQGQQWAQENQNTYQQIDLLHAIGESAYTQTDYETASESCKQGIQLANSQVKKPELHYYAGLSARQQGLLNEAQSHFQTAISQARQLDHATLEIQGWLNLGEVQVETGQFQAARRSSYASLGISRRVGRTALAAQAHQLLAAAHTALGATALADEAQHEAAQLMAVL